jgi:thiol-disulfide isomerase/thioredoxin
MDMNNKMKFGLVVLAGASILAYGVGQAEPKVPTLGKIIPDFKMQTFEGKNIIRKDLSGKVVLLDFFATWCPPCLRAMPTMKMLHEKFSSRGFTVIAVNTNEEQLSTRNKFIRDHKFVYPVTIDNDKLTDAWKIEGTPHFILFDQRGIVQKVYGGFNSNYAKSMEADISKLLPCNVVTKK